MARRSRFGFVATAALLLVVFLYMTLVGGGRDQPVVLRTPLGEAPASAAASAEVHAGHGAHDTSKPDAVAALPDDLLTGGAIAPKLGNETAKQELGRASWRLLHTMMARFPEKPTADESLALKTYVQLFARLYPCGECAAHFQKLLAAYPPQTSGRSAAAGWACFVHNEVNTRLQKPLFDCNNIGDFYDCGCGDNDDGGDDDDAKKTKATIDGTAAEPETVLGAAATGGDDTGPIALEREGLSRGG